MHSRVRDCGCLVDLVVRAENLQDPFLARKPRNHMRLDGGKVRVHEFVAGLGHQCRPHQLRQRTGVRCRTAFARLPSGSPSRVLHTLPRPKPTPRLPEASYGKKLTVTRAYIRSKRRSAAGRHGRWKYARTAASACDPVPLALRAERLTGRTGAVAAVDDRIAYLRTVALLQVLDAVSHRAVSCSSCSSVQQK